MPNNKETFVVCPIDDHHCTLPQCLEYEGTEEQPCIASVKHLASAAVQITKINFAFSIYENIDKPTLDEIGNSINISSALIDISERLNVDLSSLLEKVVEAGSVELKKGNKKI
jgi:hypothetical protein